MASDLPVASPNPLEEARETLAELLSRDPEGHTRKDRDKVVMIFREQRERLAQAPMATQGVAKGKSGKGKLPGASSTELSLEELGL